MEHQNIRTLLNLTVYRLTVLKNMKTKVNRVITNTETVETEVEFPKYTRDDFFYYKYYSFDHCISVSVLDRFATVQVDYNNNGKNLFDEDITAFDFYLMMSRASELLMPELQPKQEETI